MLRAAFTTGASSRTVAASAWDGWHPQMGLQKIARSSPPWIGASGAKGYI